MFQRWCHNMGKENWEPREDSYLCSQHFEPSCLKKNQGKYFKLKKGNVPTIFNESFENIQDPRPLTPQSSNNAVLMQIHSDNKIVDIDQHSTNQVSVNPSNDLQKTNVLTNCSNGQEKMLNNLLTHNTAVIEENQVPNICTEKNKMLVYT